MKGGMRRDSRGSFDSELIDRIRADGNVWRLDGGEIRLPAVFGFCRGVKRALAMLDKAADAARRDGQKLFLLGQIIHNPWVNDYFVRRGVRILAPGEIARLEEHVAAGDCAVIPAFGVAPQIERRLRAVGCRVVDTTCGDVRRLWLWAERAARAGAGVLIFGRVNHDETVVTRSRLAEAGGKYLVVGSLAEAEQFCSLLAGGADGETFRRRFAPAATNADGLAPFERLAQVSQTTMLHGETLAVRQKLRAAFERRFGPAGEGRLTFQPTVCRATQARQAAAVELCGAGADLVVVVGGFGSSNTRHLYELARQRAPAFFIEDSSAIRSGQELLSFDPAAGAAAVVTGWLPARRPLRVAVLAGASSPEIVVGQVVAAVAELLR